MKKWRHSAKGCSALLFVSLLLFYGVTVRAPPIALDVQDEREELYSLNLSSTLALFLHAGRRVSCSSFFLSGFRPPSPCRVYLRSFFLLSLHFCGPPLRCTRSSWWSLLEKRLRDEIASSVLSWRIRRDGSLFPSSSFSDKEKTSDCTRLNKARPCEATSFLQPRSASSPPPPPPLPSFLVSCVSWASSSSSLG